MSIRGRRAWKRAAFTRTKRAAARAVVAAVVLCGLAPRQAAARVTLPAVIGDHMVLQQQTDVALWGTTDRGRDVVVVTPWDQKKYTARPDAEGKWRLRVRTPRAGGPYRITFSDGDPLILNDVLIGEVWLASGQSNMEFKLARSADAAAAVREANYPGIRFFKVARQISETPLADAPGSAWVPASPDTAGSFSAVAYHFARTLHRQTGVPVGIIHASWGGTPAEAWTPGPVLAADARLHVAFDRWKTWERDSALTAENEARTLALYMTSRPHREPGVLYGGMIAPVVPYTLKGFLWYQGESNIRWADEYEHLLSTMIRSWRAAWETEPMRGAELPFLLVEIAPFRYSDMEAASVLREAQQRVANTVARAGIVATIDLGDMEDIHPTRKREVGERLARLALATAYAVEVSEHSGPTESEGYVRTAITDSNGRRAWTQPEWMRISKEPETARPARGAAQFHSLTHPSLTP